MRQQIDVKITLEAELDVCRDALENSLNSAITYHGGTPDKLCSVINIEIKEEAAIYSADPDPLREAMLQGMRQACGYCRDGRIPVQGAGGSWWHEVARGKKVAFNKEPCKAHWHHACLHAAEQIKTRRST